MIKKAFVLLSLTLSLSANSAIIDMGAITRDTGTGLEWLDLTESRGLSYNQVSVEFGSGGSYEGWRYATAAEFDQLVTNFGYVAITPACAGGVVYCDSGLATDDALVEYMIRTLGDTADAQNDANSAVLNASPTGAGWAWGILGTQILDNSERDTANIADREWVWRSNGNHFDDLDDLVETLHNSITPDAFSGNMGSYLVRTSVVPIPAAAWMFASGLIGLLCIKRRKTSYRPL